MKRQQQGYAKHIHAGDVSGNKTRTTLTQSEIENSKKQNRLDIGEISNRKEE